MGSLDETESPAAKRSIMLSKSRQISQSVRRVCQLSRLKELFASDASCQIVSHGPSSCVPAMVSLDAITPRSQGGYYSIDDMRLSMSATTLSHRHPTCSASWRPLHVPESAESAVRARHRRGVDLPKPSFEEPDGPPPSAEDQVDIKGRTARKIEIFQHCRDLQGTTFPRLYGLVSPDKYPRSTAPKLMLQHLDAEPVGTSDYTWRCIWADIIQQAMEAAFSRLHTRRLPLHLQSKLEMQSLIITILSTREIGIKLNSNRTFKRGQ